MIMLIDDSLDTGFFLHAIGNLSKIHPNQQKLSNKL